MPVQRHAVIVQPQQWTGPPAELARLLSPFTGADVSTLTAALDRGPMTVEADLHAADAANLTRRLTKLGIPATIDPPPQLDDLLDAPPAFNTPRERITAEVPRKRSNTVVGHKTMPPTPDSSDTSDDGGWGALFPDLATAAPEPAPPANYPPSLDDLEGPDGMATGPRAPKIAPAAGRRRHTTAPLAFEPDDFNLDDLNLDDIEVVLPDPPRRAPAPPTPTPSRTLDHATLSAVLPDDDAAPPYQPTGFDPRPEHHPPFAAAFAVLAPGAGHVFNGDDDGAMRTLTRAWKVVPWVRSVAESRADAEKIRTYWAPRPPDGNGLRAFRWAAIFWVCVGLAALLAVTLVPLVVDMAQTRAPQEDPLVRVTTAVQSASTTALAARVAALDAVAEASRDIVTDHRYTLSEEERSQRLFAIALPECKRQNYPICAAMMRRILELKPGFTPAIRLQAWASVSMNGRKEPMPDVGDVPTLSKLELSKLRQEMALDGEDVPPPPDDDVEEAPDAREEVAE